MKKIIISLSIIGVVAAVIVGGTIAFFSDTETSTGNTFTAGAIDLTVDNESYVTGPDGILVLSEETSWKLDDLTGQLFFNFSDLKPGDIGEDTISLHVDSNDAYLCAALQITDNSDQSCTEPELEDDAGCPDGGELAQNIEFAFWADDGDNVYETGEVIFLKGKLSEIGLVGQIALADSQYNVWTEVAGPLGAGQTQYIGKVWCFGDLSLDAKNPAEEGDPIARGTGFGCSGAAVNNASQTDRVMGDIQFYAVQARNNSGFTCADYNPQFPGTRTLTLENKNTSDWNVINDNTKATLTYNTAGDTFNFTLDYFGLTASTQYALIYYADQQSRFTNWGGDTIGKVIHTFTTSTSDGTETDTPDLAMDLPHPDDWNTSGEANYCDGANGYDNYNTCRGAKIWLVPTSDLTNNSILPLNAWNPTTYLFETDLINYNDTNN